MKGIQKLFLPSVVLVLILIFLVYIEGFEKNTFFAILSYLLYLIFKDKGSKFYSDIKKVLGERSWKRSLRELEKSGKLHEDTQIRISFAYLFRIKVDGKYFLVVNTRTKKYQPVGGAYKFTNEEAVYLSKNIPAENDDCIPVDEVTQMDYRLIVKAKDLKDFIKRFDNTTYRESINNLSREFVEEIFKSGILKKGDFGNLTYRYCGRHITDIVKSPFDRFEILLADIVEIDLTEQQVKLFRELMENDSKLYKFATPKEIRSLGIKTGSHELIENIANHTYKILTENEDQLFKNIRYKYKYRLPITIPL